jgi:hypothetical protein
VEDDEYDMCVVELYINYAEQLLTISIAGESEFYSDFEDQEVHIYTIVDGSNAKSISVKHILEHACSDYECEKNFVIQHIDWFIGVNFTDLQKQLIPLIFDDNKGPGEQFILVVEKKSMNSSLKPLCF